MSGLFSADGLSGSWESGAEFSPCERFRYRLWRRWDRTKPMLMFCLLNPSTADAEKSDPTVTRCGIRARAAGYGGLYIGNIFAFRSTDPANLYGEADPIGPCNDDALLMMANDSESVIFGCGNHGAHRGRCAQVLAMLKLANKPIKALAVNASGYPKHPLYVGYETQPKLWDGCGIRFAAAVKGAL